MDAPATQLYPMRLVTRLTGLSADTIRAWERRHGAVMPARTEGNTRRYTAREVRRLLLLREATRRGHSIGSIASMGTRALEGLLEADQPGVDLLVGQASTRRTATELVESYVGALCRYDGRTALQLLLRCASRMERQQLVRDVLTPIANEVDQRWPSSVAVGSSHRNLWLHHLHVLAGSLNRPSAVSLPDGLRVIASGDGTPRSEVVVVLAAIALSRPGLEPILIGIELHRPEVEWALEMSQATALIYVGDVPIASSPLPGLPIVPVGSTEPDWPELERWAAGLGAFGVQARS